VVFDDVVKAKMLRYQPSRPGPLLCMARAEINIRSRPEYQLVAGKVTVGCTGPV